MFSNISTQSWNEVYNIFCFKLRTTKNKLRRPGFTGSSRPKHQEQIQNIIYIFSYQLLLVFHDSPWCYPDGHYFVFQFGCSITYGIPNMSCYTLKKKNKTAFISSFVHLKQLHGKIDQNSSSANLGKDDTCLLNEKFRRM